MKKSTIMRWALMIAVGFAFTAVGGEGGATVRIAPAKVAQLKRMEPLSMEKVKVLMESGQLDPDQADVVLKALQPDGSLKLPDTNIGAEMPVRVEMPQKVIKEVIKADGSLNVLAYIKMLDQQQQKPLQASQAAHLSARIKAYQRQGTGERQVTLAELKQAGPGANALIASAYKDPIDFIIKVNLWRAVANRRNPGAAGFIAYTHQQFMNQASPVLIPYDKDVGGLLFRRRLGRELPLERWYSSRDVREIALDLEKLISRCAGVRAASYLIEVYAARYEADEAPMRDKKRDRHLMVQACGGNRRDFDQDEPDKWGSSLGFEERAYVAERLVPHLRSRSGSVRQIAMNGLMIALGVSDKKLKKRLENAHKEWGKFMKWYVNQRGRLLERRGK